MTRAHEVVDVGDDEREGFEGSVCVGERRGDRVFCRVDSFSAEPGADFCDGADGRVWFGADTGVCVDCTEEVSGFAERVVGFADFSGESSDDFCGIRLEAVCAGSGKLHHIREVRVEGFQHFFISHVSDFEEGEGSYGVL